jgi:hypothetical protein
MTVKVRKSGTLTCDGSGNASGAIGLGAPYGRVIGFEFKGITGSDATVTLQLVDRDGRIVFAAKSFAPFTDDSTTKLTEQVTSTKGVKVDISGYPAVANNFDQAGTAGTAAGRSTGGVAARSPVTANITTGTSTETLAVNLIVEV